MILIEKFKKILSFWMYEKFWNIWLFLICVPHGEHLVDQNPCFNVDNVLGIIIRISELYFFLSVYTLASLHLSFVGIFQLSLLQHILSNFYRNINFFLQLLFFILTSCVCIISQTKCFHYNSLYNCVCYLHLFCVG